MAYLAGILGFLAYLNMTGACIQNEKYMDCQIEN